VELENPSSGSSLVNQYSIMSHLSKSKPLIFEETLSKIGGVLLSIGIQAMESYIFIDSILPRLQEEGIVAIPKHDAVLVADSDYNRAKEIVQDVLCEFFGMNNPNLCNRNFKTR